MIKLQCGRAYKMAKVLKYMPSKKMRIKKRAYEMVKAAKYMPINKNNKKALLKSSAIYFKNH